MKLKPLAKVPFIVIAADPDSDWRLHRLDVDATSVDDAKSVARAELAPLKRDHWSIQFVRQRSAA